VKEISQYIQNKITSIGKPEKAKWLENYVKHNIVSKGVGIPEIREVIKNVNKKYNISDTSISEQAELLNDLMQQAYTEDKLAAIIYIQLFWKEVAGHKKLDLISKWFDNNLISGWNVCDWLCVRLLSPLIDNEPALTIAELKQWNTDSDLWKARASLVPFAECKTIKNHWGTI